MDPFLSIRTNNISDLKKYLIDQDINILNDRKMNLLSYAIICNNLNIFSLLIDNYIDINSVDIYKNTPAHYCVINNRLGFLKTLVRTEAILDIKNKEDRTPLYLAFLLGRKEIISLLLEKLKLDLSDKDIYQDTVFNAIIRSHNLDILKSVKVSSNLLENKNINYETPLHICTKINDIEITKFILEKKVFVNAKDILGNTPIVYAIKNNNLELTKLLITNGAILEIKNKEGLSILDILDNSIIKEDILAYLLEINYSNYKKIYPLHYYILLEDIKNISLYLNNRYLTSLDSNNYYPIDLAKLVDNKDIIKLIKSKI